MPELLGIFGAIFSASAPSTTITSDIFEQNNIVRMRSITELAPIRTRALGEPNLVLAPAANRIQEIIQVV